jgi:hypothetical protein
MPATSPALRSRRRIRSIPANSRSTRRCARRCLRPNACRPQNPHSRHHPHRLRHCRFLESRSTFQPPPS